MITNKKQLFWLIYLFLSALHVLGDIFAHHQEHLTVLTASDIFHRYCCRLVSLMSWNWCSISSCSWWWVKISPETC